MISLAVDATNDIIYENGEFRTVEDGAEVVQHLKHRLLFYLAEWVLDLGAGTPYTQEIFVKPVNLGNVETIFKNRILRTPEFAFLTEFFMNFEGGDTRKLTVTFAGETSFGFIDLTQVTINV